MITEKRQAECATPTQNPMHCGHRRSVPKNGVVPMGLGASARSHPKMTLRVMIHVRPKQESSQSKIIGG